MAQNEFNFLCTFHDCSYFHVDIHEVLSNLSKPYTHPQNSENNSLVIRK